MNQERFLTELAHLLQDLPEEEREEALDFYRCYFEDAGIENEASVIAELGSPEKVAYTIKESMKDQEDRGEYTENGYHTYEDKRTPATLDADTQSAQHDFEQADTQDYYRDARIFEEKKRRREERERQQAEQERQQQDRRQQADQERQQQDRRRQNESQAEQDRRRRQEENIRRHNQRTRSLLLFPFWLIAVIVMIVVMVVVIVAVVAVAGALGIGVFAAVIGGIGMLAIGTGIAAGGAVFAGLAILGSGLLAIAIGVLFILGLVAFCKKPLPAAIRAICNATGNVIDSLSGSGR